MDSPDGVDYEDALKIMPGERDQDLALNTARWPDPETIPDGWTQGSSCLHRVINRGPSDADRTDRPLAVSLKESILRFPSAPIHGVHRLHQYHNNLEVSQSLHTYRILTSLEPAETITRIFLFHNGLNELDRMGLYYQLASHLIEMDNGVACILRPFPGHLSRAPFADFPENPLHRYLWDGSHLFRQFLRYMTETQWFLSALVKRSRYRCLSGTTLLAAGDQIAGSRLEPDILKDAMMTAWGQLHGASERALKAIKNREPHAPEVVTILPDESIFRDAVTSLRDVLNLDAYDDLDSELGVDDTEPSLHVIGYSLGGFAAQSVFMSWPFVIKSCSTLLSGGALRELSPTAFASPEEWQTVLHSLRYELDDGMLGRRYGLDDSKPAGLDRDLFLYFQRTFYEVFQQEYRGSFKSRLAAFRQRMLFVVGGDDPIVRPQSVLDSGPPGGINLLEIGGLGHFLGARPKDSEEEQQRKFWLPEIGRLIDRFSVEATSRHTAEQPEIWLNRNLEVNGYNSSGDDGDGPTSPEVQRLSERDVLDVTESGALPSKLFELSLEDLLARQRDIQGSLLMISRNEIPTVLLDVKAVQRRARAIYHDDFNIVQYCHGIKTRWRALDKNPKRTRLIMPWNAKSICEGLDPEHGFPSQSETAVGHMPDEMTPATIWSSFKLTCNDINSAAPGSIVIFDGRQPLDLYQGMPVRAKELIQERQLAGGDDNLWVPSLPDCWIWVSPKFLGVEPSLANTLTIPETNEFFIAAVNKLHLAGEASRRRLAEHLHNDEIRVITVSRARYNPRFRGRLVIDSHAVKPILLHVALCLATSYQYDDFDLDTSTASVARRAQITA
jgi:pimeloyl-ACP methyl ester carboxylesterase